MTKFAFTFKQLIKCRAQHALFFRLCLKNENYLGKCLPKADCVYAACALKVYYGLCRRCLCKALEEKFRLFLNILSIWIVYKVYKIQINLTLFPASNSKLEQLRFIRSFKCTPNFFRVCFSLPLSLCVRCSWNISCVSVKILVKYPWMPEQIYPPLFPLLKGATKSLRHAPSCPVVGSLFDPLMPIKRSHVFRACCVNFLCARVVPRLPHAPFPIVLFGKFLHVTYCLLPISNTFSGLRLAERWISLSQCHCCWHWHCHCQCC